LTASLGFIQGIAPAGEVIVQLHYLAPIFGHHIDAGVFPEVSFLQVRKTQQICSHVAKRTEGEVDVRQVGIGLEKITGKMNDLTADDFETLQGIRKLSQVILRERNKTGTAEAYCLEVRKSLNQVRREEESVLSVHHESLNVQVRFSWLVSSSHSIDGDTITNIRERRIAVVNDSDRLESSHPIRTIVNKPMAERQAREKHSKNFQGPVGVKC
jgi:hypothetical protein